jgi:CheY-like chemotaxis protein
MKTGVKILIVDDDLDFVEISKLSLERQGYKIQSAPNAKEGWKMVEKEKPDLIIMDLMMEHLDAGMVLSQKIKNHPQYSSIPILMLTSITRDTGLDFTPRTGEDLKKLNVDDFSMKPIKAKVLLEKVEKLLALQSSPGRA